MHMSKSEILLALRSPDSGWLGVLATVLDEANKDPRFDAAQREILCQMLQNRALADDVADAARRRATVFETQIIRDCQPEAEAQPLEALAAPARPKLTLVGNFNG